MTWSIIARDPASGAFGVAIATRFFAVGALCPHAQSGVGALSTQALMNPHYGPKGLELLRSGVPAPEVVERLTAPDEGREQRQLHVIDAAGRIGQHTGSNASTGAAPFRATAISVAGNMLANERVVRETARASGRRESPSLNGCSPPSKPAKRRAATSAASSRPRCSSIRPRSIPSSACASTTTRAAGRAAPPVRQGARALRPVHALRPEQGAAVGRARPQPDRARDCQHKKPS
jgi:hypothetical protein